MAIGGFESAFLVDLVAIYLLEETINLFGEEHPFKGMYCDIGIYVTKETWNVDNIQNWLNSFQQQVDILVGSKNVQFTGVIWDIDYIHRPDDMIDKDGMVDLGGGITVGMNNFSVY